MRKKGVSVILAGEILLLEQWKLLWTYLNYLLKLIIVLKFNKFYSLYISGSPMIKSKNTSYSVVIFTKLRP